MTAIQKRQAHASRGVPPARKMIRTSGIDFTERVCQYIKHLNTQSRGTQRWDVDCSGLHFALLRDQDGMGIRFIFDPTQCNFSRIDLKGGALSEEKHLLGVQKILGCEDADQLTVIQLK